jgi:ferritin-like metal-binding protein YciE
MHSGSPGLTMMTKALSNHYFRYLRDLYSVELQIISLIPEICGGMKSSHVSELIEEARQRRDVLELIALDHDISAAGDDCMAMRSLARQARASIAECDGDSASREKVAIAACEKIRKHTHSGYKVVRLLAEQLDFPVDAARFGKLLDSSFTEVATYPISRVVRPRRELIPV